jgi:hypothetical protein
VVATAGVVVIPIVLVAVATRPQLLQSDLVVKKFAEKRLAKPSLLAAIAAHALMVSISVMAAAPAAVNAASVLRAVQQNVQQSAREITQESNATAAAASNAVPQAITLNRLNKASSTSFSKLGSSLFFCQKFTYQGMKSSNSHHR